MSWTPGRDHWWHEAMAAPGLEPLREAPPTDPETPYMIIYTSGTTGRPKGVVHVHGGFPIKAAQDIAHDFDLRPGDRLFWLTDMGWMMGPWAISGALLLGASMVLYEGTPDFRTRPAVVPGRPPWRDAPGVPDGHPCPHGARLDLAATHDLSRLRVLGSTGEPWNPEPWWWFFREVGRRPLPDRQLQRGDRGQRRHRERQPADAHQAVRLLGAGGRHSGRRRGARRAAGARDRRRAGHPGPMPGMTRGFWRDRQRYLETYWSRFPGIWVHGDWALVDE